MVGFFDHSVLGAKILCGESAGEHPAALDTVISRTLACCHFERSGSSAVAVFGEGGSVVEKSRLPPSRVAS